MACTFIPLVPKLAAGLFFACPEDGTVLLARRSGSCSEPGVWAIAGGTYDPIDLATAGNTDDAPLATATREAVEELGEVPSGASIAYVYPAINRDGLLYVTYVVPISAFDKRAWTITLNPENDAYGWFHLTDLPEPMHPGVLAVIDRCPLFNESC